MTGKFLSVGNVPNPPGPGRSFVRVRHSPVDRVRDLFQRGKIQVTGFSTYRITNSAAAYSSSGLGDPNITILDVEQFPANVPANTDVLLFDDDERFLQNDVLYASQVNLPSPPLPANGRSGEFVSGMQFRFDPAYIKLVDANGEGWNTTQTISFRLNERSAGPGFVSHFDQGNLILKGKDTPQFWCFSVVFGYQPEKSEDGDGREELPLSGESPYHRFSGQPAGYSVIWYEALRDYTFGAGREKVDPHPANFNIGFQADFYRNAYTNWLYGTIAHELGHGPGRQEESADHDELGLMRAGADKIDEASAVFTPKTILRFRSRPSWTD